MKPKIKRNFSSSNVEKFAPPRLAGPNGSALPEGHFNALARLNHLAVILFECSRHNLTLFDVLRSAGYSSYRSFQTLFRSDDSRANPIIVAIKNYLNSLSPMSLIWLSFDDDDLPVNDTF